MIRLYQLCKLLEQMFVLIHWQNNNIATIERIYIHYINAIGIERTAHYLYIRIILINDISA